VLITIVPAKKGKMRTVLLSRAFAQGFLICVMVGFFAPLLRAQEIRITVLSGRTGKPITKECVNVWIGTGRRTHVVAATDKGGVAVLHFSEKEIVAQSACQGWPVRASRGSDLEGITVSGDYYVACQEYGKVTPGEPPTDPLNIMPSYPIKRILESGVSAGNTCGKFRAEARPGELILYVRPRSFSERMRQ
jgi:hypothetical protein